MNDARTENILFSRLENLGNDCSLLFSFRLSGEFSFSLRYSSGKLMSPFDAAVFIVKTVGWLVRLLAVIVGSIFERWSDFKQEWSKKEDSEGRQWNGRPTLKDWLPVYW